MNYTGPKVKLSRKLGIALTPKAKKYMEKKPYPPGQHGSKRRMRVSDYKRQLFEKQKLRYQYNINERQMRVIFAKASAMKGTTTPEAMVQLLEARLDAVVLRGGLARSIFAARQYVSHGHFLVDGKKVDRPSYRVKPGQVISVRQKSKKMEMFHNAVKAAYPPPYIELDKPSLSVKYLYTPRRDEIPVICNEILVVEYYSRK
jgi:small subunit ribosomal protein S4